MNQNQGPSLKIYVAQDVPIQMLQELLEHEETLQWIYVESAADRQLMFKSTFLKGGALETWHHGRAFGPGCEVDWWSTPTGLRLRLLTLDSTLEGPPWQRSQPADLHPRGGPYALRLHGTLVEGQGPPPIWSEARIPQDLRYPLPGEAPWPERVGLEVQDYERDGQVCLSRWLRIVPLDQDAEE
jgi:hypothetical protein